LFQILISGCRRTSKLRALIQCLGMS